MCRALLQTWDEPKGGFSAGDVGYVGPPGESLVISLGIVLAGPVKR